MMKGLHPFLVGQQIRIFRLLYLLDRTKGMPEPIAECGVGSGYSMAYLLDYLNKSGDGRRYFGFDTFEGFPYIHQEDLVNLPEHRKKVSVVGRYREFDYKHISRLARHIDRKGLHQLVRGRFDETIPKLPSDVRFSVAFLDCDLYESYRSCLNAIYPRVVPGGYLLFDEYEETVHWPGARKAIDEFFADKPEKPEPLPFGTSWAVRKQG
jgi:predicted O-methyltransferase YrrM